MVNKIKDNNQFIENARASIDTIFTTSTQYIPNVIGTFIEIALKYKDRMLFNPDIVTTVCQFSDLYSGGALLLEEYLIAGIDEAGTTKRMRGVEDVETNYWIKLAE